MTVDRLRDDGGTLEVGEVLDNSDEEASDGVTQGAAVSGIGSPVDVSHSVVMVYVAAEDEAVPWCQASASVPSGRVPHCCGRPL